MFVNKKHIVLEAGVEVRLEAKLHHDWIVVAVDVRINPVQPLEELFNESGKCFWELYTFSD